MGGTILQTIIETKREEVARERQRCGDARMKELAEAADRPRDFFAAIAGGGAGGVRLIAEIKKSSPSAGLIRPDFDPVAIARSYEAAGAAALSVLTDRTYFGGELAFIEAVKKATALPVLRKDFLIEAYQVYESRAAGADAILLIAEVLTTGQMAEFLAIAERLGMTSLIEVHDEAQLDGALPLLKTAGRAILGINNRDLRVQRTDLATTARLAKGVPAGTVLVSESGIGSRADVEAVRQAGATGILVGESLLREADIGRKVRELMGGVE